MLDEHLYWVMVYSGWFDELGWSVIRQPFFSCVRRPMRPFAAALARRRVVRALRAQGTGRQDRLPFPAEEIYTLGNEDVHALSHCLAATLISS